MSQLQIDWVDKAFGIHMETARRKILRSELAKKAEEVNGVIAESLKSITGTSYGNSTTRDQTKMFQELLSGSLVEGDFTSDSSAVTAFDSIVTKIENTIEKLKALAGQLQSVGTAQGLDTEETKKMEQLRDKLREGFATDLKEIGEKQEIIHKEISPDKTDMDIRDYATTVYKAFSNLAFQQANDPVAFQVAYDEAFDKLATFRSNVANKGLDDLVDKYQPITIAKAKFTQAREALNLTKECKHYTSIHSQLDKELGTELPNFKEMKTEEVVKKSDRYLEITKIAQEMLPAEQLCVEFDTKVDNLAKVTDRSPAQDLRKAWTEIIQESGRQLGSDKACEEVKKIETTITKISELNEQVAELRKRAKNWKETKDKDAGLLTKDELKLIQVGDELYKKITSDLVAMGTLASELTQAEETLAKVLEKLKPFKELASNCKQSISGIKTAKLEGFEVKKTLGEKVQQAESNRSKTDGSLVELEKLRDFLLEVPNSLETCEFFFREVTDKSPRQSIISRLPDVFRTLDKSGLAKLTLDAKKFTEKARVVLKYNEEYNQHKTSLDMLAKSSTLTIANLVNKTRDNARNFADKANLEMALSTLKSLTDKISVLTDFVNQTDKTMQEAIKISKTNQNWPMQIAITELIQSINTLAGENKFPEAVLQITTLGGACKEADNFNKHYAATQELLSEVKVITVEQLASTYEKENESFQLRLDSPVAASEAGVKEAVNNYLKLVGELNLAKDSRLNATAKALGGKDKDPRIAKILENKDTRKAAMAVAKSLGEAELKKLIAKIGTDSQPTPEDDKLGLAVGKLLTGLASIKSDELLELSKEVGGVEKLAELCDNTGDPKTIIGLHKQFAGSFKDLGTLVKDGLSGSPKRLRTILGNGDECGKRAKQLSDGFTDRKELVTLLDNMDFTAPGKSDKDNSGNVKAKDVKISENLMALVATNFGKPSENWGKLKKPFFDELATSGDAKRLMQKAINFKGMDVGTPPLPTDKQGHSSVDMEHFMKRHLPGYFDMADIKEKNSQFPPTLTPTQLATIVNNALAAIKNGGTNVVGPKVNGSFKTYKVTLSNYKLKVGIETKTVKQKQVTEVTQIYPLEAYGTATLDDFTEAQMKSLKGALGR